MTLSKYINKITTPVAIIITGVLISLSVFTTVWVFFGGKNNRNKLFLDTPQRPVPVVNTLSKPQARPTLETNEDKVATSTKTATTTKK